MSHEMVQEIKLVKYNRKSHEMISVTCKRIPTMVNKEIHKNGHSHEMTRFRNRIGVWSSLHEPVLIYGSSHGSSSNRPCIGSTMSTNPDRVWVSCNGSGSHRTNLKHCNTQPNIQININTHSHTRI